MERAGVVKGVVAAVERAGVVRAAIVVVEMVVVRTKTVVASEMAAPQHSDAAPWTAAAPEMAALFFFLCRRLKERVESKLLDVPGDCIHELLQFHNTKDSMIGE